MFTFSESCSDLVWILEWRGSENPDWISELVRKIRSTKWENLAANDQRSKDRRDLNAGIAEDRERI
jgi:hypothetical protein